MSLGSRRVLRFLTSLGTVYGQSTGTGPTGGRYTVVLKTDLRCREMPLAAFRNGGGLDRSELSRRRTIAWEPDYEPPSEFVQFEIDGTRWQAARGTFDAIKRRTPTVIYRECEATRIEPRVP